MTTDFPRTPHPPLPCTWEWCTTPHGATQHPDDEQHRSAGIGTSALVRTPGRPARRVDVETGLVARDGDDEPWVAIELDDARAIELTVTSARRILRALLADPAVAAVVCPRVPPP